MGGQRYEKRTDGEAHYRYREFVYAVVPGHVHLHKIGQLVKAEIEKLGCFAAEFNTIAIDDGMPWAMTVCSIRFLPVIL